MRWLLLLLLLATACGGGGGSSAPDTPVAPPPPSRFVHLGYFGNFGFGQIEATASHTSITMEGGDDLPARMNIARANGLKVILTVEQYVYTGGRYRGNVAGVRALLDQLRNLGMLDLVIGFYSADEPDLHYSDSDVRGANAAIRALCTEFPQLASCLLVVIYSDHFPVGLDSFDWVGRDAYGQGPQSMTLAAGQRLILVPGGASPWRESPDAFVTLAQADPQVVAVLAFVYPNYSDFGIAANGMAPQYCRAGRALTQKPGAC